MVPLAIAGIALTFLLVEVAIQTIQHRRGKEVYGFFIPDPAEVGDKPPVNYGRMFETLRNFGIAPPHNAFVHKGHTWAAVEESGEAAIGLDPFARNALGRVDGVTLPPIGRKARQGEKLFSVRQGERIAEFVAPVDGTVSSLNERAEQSGLSQWVVKIRPSNLSDNLRTLKVAEDAVKWMYEELFRLHELVASQIPRLETVGVTMQDGALALDSLLESLDDETWEQFKKHFLEHP